LKLRGRWFDFACGEHSIPLLATLHPAFLLRQPAQKRLAWRDFMSLKQKHAGERR
jgi:DNA polymerase